MICLALHMNSSFALVLDETVFQLVSLFLGSECYCRLFWWVKSIEKVNCKAMKNDLRLFPSSINNELDTFSPPLSLLLFVQWEFFSRSLSLFHSFVYLSFYNHLLHCIVCVWNKRKFVLHSLVCIFLQMRGTKVGNSLPLNLFM